jgi:hypothetical protein
MNGPLAVRATSDRDGSGLGGHGVEVALESFDVADSEVVDGARAHVSDYSQWIDGWCVDWDYQGGPMRAETSIWRPRRGSLVLHAKHDYAAKGKVVARVRVFDVFGGVTTRDVAIDVGG